MEGLDGTVRWSTKEDYAMERAFADQTVAQASQQCGRSNLKRGIVMHYHTIRRRLTGLRTKGAAQDPQPKTMWCCVASEDAARRVSRRIPSESQRYGLMAH